MSRIFTPWKLGKLELPNRLVRSATWEGLADADGAPTFDLINALAALAEGGVGLIITGFMYVAQEGKAMPGQTGIHIDAMIGPLTRISDAVHKAGGKIAAQIAHGGGQANPALTGHKLLGPSTMVNPSSKHPVEAMTTDQIYEALYAMSLAAARAKAAGFDAVQLHAAHGYLLSQFLSPNLNLRADEYGGSLENRARFLYQAYEDVRQAVGPDYPIFVKLNSEDGVEGGITPAEAAEVAGRLAAMGIDGIEVSGGTRAGGKRGMPSRVVAKPADEGYFLDNAVAVKQAAGCPVISVGGWRSPSRIEAALEKVDAVALCRPFIREPGLARRWQEGDRAAASCISCNQCFEVTAKHGLGCGQELKREDGE